MIITSTCAVNTDSIPTCDFSTQTNMPRSKVAFKKIMSTKHSIQYEDDEDASSEDMSHELLEIETRLKHKRKFSMHKTLQAKNDSTIDELESKSFAVNDTTKGSDSEYEDSIHEDSKIRDKKEGAEKSSETFNSWHDINFPERKVELPKSYFAEGPTPWSNFKDLVLGDKFLSARFSPNHPKTLVQNFNQTTWSEPQLKIVNDLVQESRALMDLFDQVAMLLGPDVKLHDVSGLMIF